MRIFALALIALFLPAQSLAANWRNEELCSSRPAEFAESRQEGCSQSWCARDGAAGELCACLRDVDSEALRFTWRRADISYQWSLNALPIQQDGDSFLLQAFDPKPAADSTWLFAVREAVSNGMGVNYWQAYVLGPEGVSKPLPVQDLGVLSLMTQDHHSKSCRLLAGQWQAGYESRRGEGVYFVATWQQPVAGQWQAVSSLPSLHRRYLFAFEKERLSGLGGQTKSVLWFRHPTTRTGMPSKTAVQK